MSAPSSRVLSPDRMLIISVGLGMKTSDEEMNMIIMMIVMMMWWTTYSSTRHTSEDVVSHYTGSLASTRARWMGFHET